MKVDTKQGNKYVVKFKKLSEARKKGTIDTLCTIFKIVGNGDSLVKRNISKGIAYLHPKDKYDRGIGKKLSLEKALSEADLSKQERRDFWESFMEEYSNQITNR